jgi:hypothetical protein
MVARNENSATEIDGESTRKRWILSRQGEGNLISGHVIPPSRVGVIQLRKVAKDVLVRGVAMEAYCRRGHENTSVARVRRGRMAQDNSVGQWAAGCATVQHENGFASSKGLWGHVS